LRAVGPYFLIITLALGYLPAALAIRWRGLTGGDDGLVMPGRPSLAGISLDSPNRYFFLVSGVMLISVALMAAIARSTFGFGLRGIKESPARMNALGYRTWIYQYVIFVISAAFASIAGALNAFYNLFVSPADFGIDRSFGALVSVILGGAGTLIGPAIGSAVIMVLRHSVGAATQHWAMVLGCSTSRSFFTRRAVSPSACVTFSRVGGRPDDGSTRNARGVYLLRRRPRRAGGRPFDRAWRAARDHGPNGAGKTTFFNLIGGQLSPNFGQVLLSETTSLRFRHGSVRGADCRARSRSRAFFLH